MDYCEDASWCLPRVCLLRVACWKYRKTDAAHGSSDTKYCMYFEIVKNMQRGAVRRSHSRTVLYACGHTACGLLRCTALIHFWTSGHHRRPLIGLRS